MLCTERREPRARRKICPPIDSHCTIVPEDADGLVVSLCHKRGSLGDGRVDALDEHQVAGSGTPDWHAVSGLVHVHSRDLGNR